MQTLLQTLTRLNNNDLELYHQLSDELEQHHPFILSTMMGYTLDFNIETANDLMILHLLIWSHFRDNPESTKKQITQVIFEKALHRNIALIKYLEGEENDPISFSEVVKTDLFKIKSLALMSIIFEAFNQWPNLNQIPPKEKGLLLISIKSLIESLEGN